MLWDKHQISQFTNVHISPYEKNARNEPTPPLLGKQKK